MNRMVEESHTSHSANHEIGFTRSGYQITSSKRQNEVEWQLSVLGCKKRASLELVGHEGMISGDDSTEEFGGAAVAPELRGSGPRSLMARSPRLAVLCVLGIVSSLGMVDVIVVAAQGQQLSATFYDTTCPSVEQMVRSRMQFHLQQDPRIAANLLRVFFHDCAATGCDASLLLKGDDSEQAAGPNTSLLGFEVIDDIKAQVEATCPAAVSCADILALTGRDAVTLSGGPNFSIPLGRFDSLVSGGPNVFLPSPDSTVKDSVAFFQTLGLSSADLAILLGAHTIGRAHCSSFFDPLYNFQSTGQANPQLDPPFLSRLQATCPRANANASTSVELDEASGLVFDNSFYSAMAAGHGVLALDQELVNGTLTAGTVARMQLNESLFFQSFAASMISLGAFGVKNSTAGNVRTDCRVAGPAPATPATLTAAASPRGAPATAPGPGPSSEANTPLAAGAGAESPLGSPVGAHLFRSPEEAPSPSGRVAPARPPALSAPLPLSPTSGA